MSGRQLKATLGWAVRDIHMRLRIELNLPGDLNDLTTINYSARLRDRYLS
jgi:hypothetical protein